MIGHFHPLSIKRSMLLILFLFKSHSSMSFSLSPCLYLTICLSLSLSLFLSLPQYIYNIYNIYVYILLFHWLHLLFTIKWSIVLIFFNLDFITLIASVSVSFVFWLFDCLSNSLYMYHMFGNVYFDKSYTIYCCLH